MTAAGSTTTRGSGFFCVSLDSGRKVGVKAERSLEHLIAVQSPSHSKKTSACLSPNGCHKHLQMLAFSSKTAGLMIN